jgi:hypothetical protein
VRSWKWRATISATRSTWRRACSTTAGDNETLVTSRRARRPRPGRTLALSQPRPLQLRGRVEPVFVHLLEAQRFGDTAMTAYGDILRAPEPEGIRLVWLDLNTVYSPHSLPVILGPQPAGHLLHRRLEGVALACPHRLATAAPSRSPT